MTSLLFSDNYSRVFRDARKHAERLRSERVGIEHLLLGICLGGGSTAKGILRSLLVYVPALAKRALHLTELYTNANVVICGEIPLTPTAIVAVQRATDAARLRGSSCVGTEHLLYGIACDDGLWKQLLWLWALTEPAVAGYLPSKPVSPVEKVVPVEVVCIPPPVNYVVLCDEETDKLRKAWAQRNIGPNYSFMPPSVADHTYASVWSANTMNALTLTRDDVQRDAVTLKNRDIVDRWRRRDMKVSPNGKRIVCNSGKLTVSSAEAMKRLACSGDLEGEVPGIEKGFRRVMRDLSRSSDGRTVEWKVVDEEI